MSTSMKERFETPVRNAASCVHCGACAGQCRHGALKVDEGTRHVEFEKDRCAGCGRCVPACGYGALAGGPRGPKRKGGA